MFDEFRKYLDGKIEINDKQFEAVEKLLTYKTVKHGEVLMRPGDTYEYGMFVMKGCLRSYIVHNDKEHIMQFAPENWWIGDNNGIIKPEPAMFYIDAVEDSRLALFDHEFIPKLETIVPHANKMHKTLQSNSFRGMQKRVIHLLAYTAEERYNNFMNSYPNLVARLPQKMVASYLGMAPQSLSRIRGHFVAKNI